MSAGPPSPLDLVQLPFMRTALVELVLLGLAGGLLGSWIVLRRLAFFSHAVGGAVFPGLVIADAKGFSPQLAGIVVGLGYAGGVERAGRARRDPGDAATALGLVAALAVGIVLAGDVYHSGAAVDRLLFGTLLGLGGGDLALSAVVAALAVVATAALGRAWSAVAFDPESAPSLGVPAGAADLLLLGLIALTAVAAIPAVGALLATSVLVVPAAIARLRATGVGALLRLAVVVAVVQGALGLYLSLWLNVPPGPAVATLGTVLYGLAALAAWRSGT